MNLLTQIRYSWRYRGHSKSKRWSKSKSKKRKKRSLWHWLQLSHHWQRWKRCSSSKKWCLSKRLRSSRKSRPRPSRLTRQERRQLISQRLAILWMKTQLILQRGLWQLRQQNRNQRPNNCWRSLVRWGKTRSRLCTVGRLSQDWSSPPESICFSVAGDPWYD